MSLVAATGDILVKSILIATDFSEASDKALRHALAIARHMGRNFTWRTSFLRWDSLSLVRRQ